MKTQSSRLSILLLVLLWLVYASLAFFGLESADDIISPFVVFCAAFFLCKAGFSAKMYRLGWFFLAFAVFVWGLADVLWAADNLLLGTNPETDVRLMYLYAVPNLFFLLAILDIILSDRQPWSFFQLMLDIIAIAFSLIGFIYFAFFYNRFQSLLRFDHASISAFIYLIFDMLIITFGIYICFSLNRKRAPWFLNLAFIGIMVYAVCDVMYVYAVFNSLYIPNTWIDALYLFAIVLVGLGAVLYVDRQVDAFRIRRMSDRSGGRVYRSLLLVVIPLLAALIRPLHFQEILFFLLIIATHQLISLMLRRLIGREKQLAEKSEQAQLFEATIADRTRELRIMNQTLENLLKRDAITGQYNRKYFLEITEEWIQVAEPGEKIWMLILDFDRFKTINDTYGHDVGDQVLRLIGKRLETLSNDRTVFGRLGGDEFGIVCRRDSAESINPLLHTITDMSNRPLEVGDFTVHVSISVGVSSWPEDAHSRSDLMRHADIAMYIAKNERTSGVSFFDVSVNAGVERSHQIDLALKKADIASEFSLVYQPQVAIGGRRLVGMEALVRWESPELGTVTPDEFIPVAEENGVIIRLSDWIIRNAFAQIADWNTRYGRKLLVGINISPQQLDDPDFILKLEVALDEYRVKPEWINLEITERSAMKDESFIIEIFNRLSALNITSSIDDFGTGYSSLSYLKKFNIDYLKIAKQLVDCIATDETDVQIVQAIIMMATAMNLRTIAEGVETEKQLRILESLGCDEIQGYYFGKPQPPEEFEELFLKE